MVISFELFIYDLNHVNAASVLSKGKERYILIRGLYFTKLFLFYKQFNVFHVRGLVLLVFFFKFISDSNKHYQNELQSGDYSLAQICLCDFSYFTLFSFFFFNKFCIEKLDLIISNRIYGGYFCLSDQSVLYYAS